jgi:hypothetical protein
VFDGTDTTHPTLDQGQNLGASVRRPSLSIRTPQSASDPAGAEILNLPYISGQRRFNSAPPFSFSPLSPPPPISRSRRASASALTLSSESRENESESLQTPVVRPPREIPFFESPKKLYSSCRYCRQHKTGCNKEDGTGRCQ